MQSGQDAHPWLGDPWVGGKSQPQKSSPHGTPQSGAPAPGRKASKMSNKYKISIKIRFCEDKTTLLALSYNKIQQNSTFSHIQET